MIEFPIDVPLDDIAEVSVGNHDANTFQASGFTGRGVVQEFEADYWTVNLGYRGLDRATAQPVIAFASALRRSKGTFVLPFPGYSSPLGAAKDNPSSPSVDGGGQAGSEELLVQSAPASIQNWLLAGDIIQVGPANRPHWHRVLQDVTTNGSGAATIDVWPRIREGAADGDQVSLNSPLCLFRLIDDFETALSPPVQHRLDFSCREAI